MLARKHFSAFIRYSRYGVQPWNKKSVFWFPGVDTLKVKKSSQLVEKQKPKIVILSVIIL